MPKKLINSLPKRQTEEHMGMEELLKDVNYNIRGPNGPVITEENAYKFFGVPSPAERSELLEQLPVNMERSFSLFDKDSATPSMPLLPEIWVQIAEFHFISPPARIGQAHACQQSKSKIDLANQFLQQPNSSPHVFSDSDR
jgi:hypothetical protein